MTDRSMLAVHAINDFLGHARAHDLPDVELWELKARAFDLMADQFTEDGHAAEADESRRAAGEARAMAVRAG